MYEMYHLGFRNRNRRGKGERRGAAPVCVVCGSLVPVSYPAACTLDWLYIRVAIRGWMKSDTLYITHERFAEFTLWHKL